MLWIDQKRPIADVRHFGQSSTMIRLLCSIAAVGAASVALAEDRPALSVFLPQAAAACGAPASWVELVGADEVRLRPPPDADFAKVDCVMKRLQDWSGLKLGFIGNEADPNQIMTEPWSYIAEGRISDLIHLSTEARAAGWTVEKLAKADDGTGFLRFRSPVGVTFAKAEAFANRLWKHEFGDVKYGRPPDRNGTSFNYQ